MAYDAALGRATWQFFVDSIAAAFDAVHAVVAPRMPDRGTGRMSGIFYAVSRRPCGTYHGQDLLMERAWRLPRGELSVVSHMGADPFIGRSPFYRATLAEIDIGHAVHVMLPVRAGEVAFFCLTRFESQPEFDDAELAAIRALVDNLSRALEIEDRLTRPVQREIFENLPYGLAIVDRHSKVRRMNRLAQSLIAAEDGLHMHLDSLHVATGRLDVEGFLNLPPTATGGPPPLSFRIERSDCDQPLAAMFAAIPAEWRDAVHDDAAALLVLSDPEWVLCPSEDALIGIYRLTPGEARFARTLVRHRSLQKASTELAISHETARRHLKSTFEKTMTHSQPELIDLLVRQPSATMDIPAAPTAAGCRFKPAAE